MSSNGDTWPADALDPTVLIPHQWVTQGKDIVRVRGFLAYGADPAQPDPNPKFIEFEQARAAIYFGRLHYAIVRPIEVRVRARREDDAPEIPNPALEFHASPAEIRTTEPGLYSCSSPHPSAVLMARARTALSLPSELRLG